MYDEVVLYSFAGKRDGVGYGRRCIILAKTLTVNYPDLHLESQGRRLLSRDPANIRTSLSKVLAVRCYLHRRWHGVRKVVEDTCWHMPLSYRRQIGVDIMDVGLAAGSNRCASGMDVRFMVKLQWGLVPLQSKTDETKAFCTVH